MKTSNARRAKARAIYLARKVAQRCVRCNAGLGDDDGVKCCECTALHASYSKTYMRSEKGLATNRAKSRRTRAKRMANGQCIDCSKPATKGRRCDVHSAVHVKRCQKYRSKRAARAQKV